MIFGSDWLALLVFFLICPQQLAEIYFSLLNCPF